MERKPDRIKKIIGLLLRGLIVFYRHTLSYFLGRHCRFLPSCSSYADEAIRIHGPFKGASMSFRRFCRCHPFGGSGFDPVPGNED
ncbi:MAG: membrane protein insertion efficiency factor YidD [Pseudomonadota bacterium]|nr:membrane protein insertion efficiency factor YidD [Pseudomonadota bacterium]